MLCYSDCSIRVSQSLTYRVPLHSSLAITQIPLQGLSMMTTPTTDQFCVHYSNWLQYNWADFYIQIDCIILTPVGFVSYLFLIPFIPQKGTLWWFVHLHANSQPIPCRHDKPLTFFMQKKLVITPQIFIRFQPKLVHRPFVH